MGSCINSVSEEFESHYALICFTSGHCIQSLLDVWITELHYLLSVPLDFWWCCGSFSFTHSLNLTGVMAPRDKKKPTHPLNDNFKTKDKEVEKAIVRGIRKSVKLNQLLAFFKSYHPCFSSCLHLLLIYYFL